MYEKPSWKVKLIAKKQTENIQDLEYENYQCRARIVTYESPSRQTQTQVQALGSLDSEGEQDEQNVDEITSAFGRESDERLSQTDQSLEGPKIEENLEVDATVLKKGSDFVESMLSRKIIELDEERENETVTDTCTTDPKNKKQNEAMLWHARLGHASLNYLRRLQKLDDRLKER